MRLRGGEDHGDRQWREGKSRVRCHPHCGPGSIGVRGLRTVCAEVRTAPVEEVTRDHSKSSGISAIAGWSGVSMVRAFARQSRMNFSSHCIWLTFDREKKWTSSESSSTPCAQEYPPYASVSSYTFPVESLAASVLIRQYVANQIFSGSENCTPIQYLMPICATAKNRFGHRHERFSREPTGRKYICCIACKHTNPGATNLRVSHQCGPVALQYDLVSPTICPEMGNKEASRERVGGC